MNSLKETTVYVPVDVKTELPSNQTNYLCNVVPNEWNTSKEAEAFFDARQSRFSIGPNDRFTAVTHWLKPQSLYIFTRAELEKILMDSFDAGFSRCIFEVSPHNGKQPQFAEYIKELLPK